MLNRQKILNNNQRSIDAKVRNYMEQRRKYNGGNIPTRKSSKYTPRVSNSIGGGLKTGSVIKTEHAFKNSKKLTKRDNKLEFKNNDYKLYHEVFKRKSVSGKFTVGSTKVEI